MRRTNVCIPVVVAVIVVAEVVPVGVFVSLVVVGVAAVLVGTSSNEQTHASKTGRWIKFLR